MDSTYVLYDWLKSHPDEQILVHHIRLRHEKENRLDLEQMAVNNILKFLSAQGLNNFIYHESAFDYGTLPRITIKDIQIVALFTSIILKTAEWESINTLLLSWHAGEVNRDDINRGYRVKAMLQALEVTREIRFVFPIEDKTRFGMSLDMPGELLRLCHCCRRPKDGKPCGFCKTCLELKEAGIFYIFK